MVTMRSRWIWGLCALMLIGFGHPAAVHPQQKDAPRAAAVARPKLVEAVLCEGIRNFAPVNRAVVFSVGIGGASCFTAFEEIPDTMFIYHSWFRRDKLITTKRLMLKAPKWATFSSIQLREADIGPWHVEIHDDAGRVLETLRFSITE